SRGNGYAYTVRAQSWPVFYAHLKIADTILSTNKAKASLDPAWYNMMEEIAVDNGDPDRAWDYFNDAMKSAKSYPDVYHAIMRGLQPMWGGSYADMEKFAQHSAMFAGKDGDELYARLYWHISGCSCNVFPDTLASWQRMKAGFQVIVKKYPTQWNVNGFAYFACKVKDKPTTKQLMQQIAEPVLAQWKGDASFYALCRTWASSA
ncbi:MAG TPA: hypothetical protein VK759_01505, partial [Rhizomicrobium sp.]|nr:hypothetical protein [Rhizomicrobium sp.]